MNSLKKAQESTFNVSCKHEVVLYLAKLHNNLACTSLGNELLFYFILNMLLIANGEKQSKPSFQGWFAHIALLIMKYSEISEVRNSNLELKTRNPIKYLLSSGNTYAALPLIWQGSFSLSLFKEASRAILFCWISHCRAMLPIVNRFFSWKWDTSHHKAGQD